MAVVKKPKVPKQQPRPFWIQGVEGWTEPDGSFYVPEEKPRVITGGNKRTTGGYNLDLYQRVSRDPRGVTLAFQIEARADLEGNLTLKVYPVIKGRRGKPMVSRTHREGIPYERLDPESDPGTDGENR